MFFRGKVGLQLLHIYISHLHFVYIKLFVFIVALVNQWYIEYIVLCTDKYSHNSTLLRKTLHTITSLVCAQNSNQGHIFILQCRMIRHSSELLWITALYLCSPEASSNHCCTGETIKTKALISIIMAFVCSWKRFVTSFAFCCCLSALLCFLPDVIYYFCLKRDHINSVCFHSDTKLDSLILENEIRPSGCLTVSRLPL